MNNAGRNLHRSMMAAVSAACMLVAVASCAQGGGDSLEEYWPIQAGHDHRWQLFDAHPANGGSVLRMTVESRRADSGQFELRFSDKGDRPPGHVDVERYIYCDQPGIHSWLFLNGYLGVDGDKTTAHPVSSTKILFTPEGGKAYDLVSNGTYARCGGRGQPYLLGDTGMSYRIQVWGTLDENPKLKWYWDATVHAAAPVTNECGNPAKTVTAIRVQESWWSNFKDGASKWTLGDGDIGADGLPSGARVSYGRSVWHASGQTPYYLTGSADGKRVGWCNK